MQLDPAVSSVLNTSTALLAPVGDIPHARPSTHASWMTRAHQHAQANIDKLQNNSKSNNNYNDRLHKAAQQYGKQAAIVPTPNLTITTQLAGGNRSNDAYQP